MAELPQGLVDVVASWTEGGDDGSLIRCALVDIKLVGGGYGSLANPIKAQVFGLRSFVEVSNFIDTQFNHLVLAAVNANLDAILLFDVTDITDATRDVPVDWVGTIRGTVKGI